MPGGTPYQPRGFMTFVGASAMVHGKTQGVYPAAKAMLSRDLRGRARPLRHRAPDRGALVHPRADEPLVHRDDPLALPQQAGAGEGRRAPRPARPERQQARRARRRHDGRRHRLRRRPGRHRGGADRPRPGRRRQGPRPCRGLARRRHQAPPHHARAEGRGARPHHRHPRLRRARRAATSWSRRSSRTRPSRPRPPAAPRQHLPADAIFATNTSTLPIGELAKASRDPAQFIGIHFFSPVDRMTLVEIIRGRGDRRPRGGQGARLRPPDPQDPDRRQRRPLLLRQPLHHPLHQRGRAHGRRGRRAGADRERRQAARLAARPAAARRRDLDRPRGEDRQGDPRRHGRRLSREPGRRRALPARRPRPARAQGQGRLLRLRRDRQAPGPLARPARGLAAARRAAGAASRCSTASR